MIHTKTFLLPLSFKNMLLSEDWTEGSDHQAKIATDFLKKHNLGKCVEVKEENWQTPTIYHSLSREYSPNIALHCGLFVFKVKHSKASLIESLSSPDNEEKLKKYKKVGYFMGYCDAQGWEYDENDLLNII